MKYIKKFNEELLPDTYRRASRKLKGYGTSQALDKSARLQDFADEKDFGLYNMHFASSTSLITTSTFTDPKLIGIYYGGLPDSNFNDDKYRDFIWENNLLNKKDTETLTEAAVRNWVNGTQPLAINFEFGLKPTQQAIKDSRYHSWLNAVNRNGRYLDQVPAFTIQLSLSEWNEGLEEYDSEAKWEAERDGGEFTPTALSDFFEWTEQQDWILYRSLCQHYQSLFSDRRSAQKFLSFFQQTMQSEKVRDSIIDLLRIINVDSKALERVLESYKKVRVHAFYDEKPPNNSFQKIWFNKRID